MTGEGVQEDPFMRVSPGGGLWTGIQARRQGSADLPVGTARRRRAKRGNLHLPSLRVAGRLGHATNETPPCRKRSFLGDRIRLLPRDQGGRPHPLVSGTTATGPNGPVAIGDAREQTRYALGKIRTAIESLGGTLADVVRTRIHVKPGTDWEAVARVHGEFFSAVRPACTLTYADLIGEEYLVEIEVEAVIGSAST